MSDKETKEIMGYRLYDILNILALQMEDNHTTKEYIQIRAFHSRTKQYNLLTVTVEEENV